jgi:hypothetical protein
MHTRFRHLLLPVALLAALLVASAARATEGFVRIEGRNFVTPDGRPFVIRGIGLGNWLMTEGYMFRFRVMKAPRQIEQVIEHLIGPEDAARFWEIYHERYVAEADVRFIAAAGFNTIRVPLHWDLFVDRRDHTRFEGPGWRHLDDLIRWSRAAGVRVIIDLHAAPGGQTGVNHDDGPGYPITFYVPAHRRLTVELWRRIAQRYKDEPAVLGYDLLNEPISPYADTDYLNPRLEGFYRELVAAIRPIDPDRPIILAASQWSTNFAVFGPPFATGLAYTYHKFWASPKRDSIQEYLNFSYRWNVPLFLGEAGELTDDWNREYVALQERFGIGWSFWPYKYMDSDSNVVAVRMPDGWSKIQAFGNSLPRAWPGLPKPGREEAKAILWAYLDAIRLENGRVNEGYLRSLGMRVP